MPLSTCRHVSFSSDLTLYLISKTVKCTKMDFLDPRNYKAAVLSVPMSLNWATRSTKSIWVPFAPTGLFLILPLCQPGAHLLWLHQWDSSHLPGPQSTLPCQPAQAALPRSGCGPGPGAQVLPGKGRERDPPRICLLLCIHASRSNYTLASLRQGAGCSYNEAATFLPP